MQQAIFIAGILILLLGAFYLLATKHKLLGGILIVLGIVAIPVAYQIAPNDDTLVDKHIHLRIVGSKTIGRSLMPELMKAFFKANDYHIIKKEEHTSSIIYYAQDPKNHQELKVEIIAKGSKEGFAALKDGTCEIAMASTQIGEEDIQKLGKRFSNAKHEHVIAYDAIQVVMHSNVGKKVVQLDLEAVSRILTGETADWSALVEDVSGTIVPILRDGKSGTFQHIKEQLFEDKALSEHSIRKDYFEKIITQVEHDSLSIGFVNFALDPYLLKNVVVIPLMNEKGNPVTPTVKSIQDESYPLTRKLYLYTHHDVEKHLIVQQIIQFCQDARAKSAVTEEGLVPLAAVY